MKTAEYIASGNHADKSVTELEIEIKSYGRKCAEQALKDASERARMVYHDGHFKNNHATQYHQMGADNIQINKQSILSTPIVTP